MVRWDSRVHNSAHSLFLDVYYKVWSSRWDQVIRLYLKIPEKFVCLILQNRYWVVHIPFVRKVKFHLLAQFPVDHHTHSVIYSFCANLLQSLIMLLIVSCQSPHKKHLLFRCVLSILALIWLVLMALFCTAICWDSVSLLRFNFPSHVHVFPCEISRVSRLKRPWSCFSSHFCFLSISVLLVYHVVSFVSGDCNQASSAL